MYLFFVVLNITPQSGDASYFSVVFLGDSVLPGDFSKAEEFHALGAEGCHSRRRKCIVAWHRIIGDCSRGAHQCAR